MRFCFCSGINITPFNGATAAVYLHNSTEDRDPYYLYHSDITPLGNKWVKKISVPDQEIDPVVESMDKLVQKFKLLHQEKLKSIK